MNNDLRGTSKLDIAPQFRLNSSLLWKCGMVKKVERRCRAKITNVWSIIKLRELIWSAFLSSQLWGFESRRVENVQRNILFLICAQERGVFSKVWTEVVTSSCISIKWKLYGIRLEKCHKINQKKGPRGSFPHVVNVIFSAWYALTSSFIRAQFVIISAAAIG